MCAAAGAALGALGAALLAVGAAVDALVVALVRAAMWRWGGWREAVGRGGLGGG